MHFFILFTLALDIFPYYLFIGILTNRVHIITTCPKTTSPQQLPDLGMNPENLPCRQTLDRIDYLPWRNHRNTLNQKMHMVGIGTNLQKVYLIAFRNSQTYFLHGMTYRIGQNFSPILYPTNEMIE